MGMAHFFGPSWKSKKRKIKKGNLKNQKTRKYKIKMSIYVLVRIVVVSVSLYSEPLLVRSLMEYSTPASNGLIS